METNIETLILSSLSPRDLRFLFRTELESYFSSNPVAAIPPQPETKKPLNIDEAAAFLGISKNTIYGKINEIPHIKKGKLLKFFEDDLLLYLKSGKVKTRKEIEADVETHLGELGQNKKNGG